MALGAAALAWGLPAGAGEAAERYVRYGFTLQNNSDQLASEVEFWACAPLRETSGQSLVNLKTTPPCEERTDALGNHLLRFVFSNVPPYAVRIATVEATLAMRPEPEPLAEVTGRWLESEPFFEYADEAFDRLAPEFPGDAPEQTARAIFDWVRGHLQNADYDAIDRGALHALVQQKGDCTEYATLFAALCRRAGIPARAMGGYVVDRNMALPSAAFHNWAEFRAGDRWILADPQIGAFNDKTSSYVATRVLGESDSPLGHFPRFRVVGEGMKAVMDP